MKKNTAACLGLLGASLLLSVPARAEVGSRQIRQWVIRAPEKEVIALLAGTEKTSDAVLAAKLQDAVREDRAALVSDLTAAVEDTQPLLVQEGRLFWLPSELDQGFDFLYMTPESFLEHWVGTRVEGTPVVAGSDAKPSLWARWNTRFSMRDPVPVRWPTSWLNTYDHENGRPSDKAVHGWLDWRDSFVETVTGEIAFGTTGPALLAVLPPADQIWPADRPGRWVDVFLVEAKVPNAAGTAAPSVEDSQTDRRSLVFAIGLPSREALALTRQRDPRQDEGLLQSLLTKSRKGEARLRLFSASAHQRSGHRAQTSARLHDYPTEMPSIPSAWNSRPVGTAVEFEGNRLVGLRQDLAPPARTVWPLAGDVPEAVMWQPRFRGLELSGEFGDSSKAGTELLGLVHVPPVMQGDGMPEDETVLIFSRSEGWTSKEEANPAESEFTSAPQPQPQPQAYEVELVVAEIPAAEEAEWRASEPDVWNDADNRRFQTLLDRVQSGQAPLIAHLQTRPASNRQTRLAISEDYNTATEFDPPETGTPQRMRPTALETLHVGTRWEVDFNAAEQGPGWNLNMTLSQSTARPVEPALEEMLVIAAAEKNDHRGAVHPEESWKESLQFNQEGARCLGTRRPPGVKGDVRHVAFMRIQRLPAK